MGLWYYDIKEPTLSRPQVDLGELQTSRNLGNSYELGEFLKTPEGIVRRKNS